MKNIHYWFCLPLVYCSFYLPSAVISVQNRNPTLEISQHSNTNLKNLGKRFAIQYLNKVPITEVPENLTLEQAKVIQTYFIDSLIPNLGKIVGYKAGLTNKAIQEKFNINHPVQGVLLEKMLLKSGVTLPANFGTRPMLEGDLMVRVGSEKINTAKTPEEVLSSLDAVIPFLELPDLVYDQKVSLNAPRLVAVNVGSRLGIMGEPITIKDPKEWEKRLRQIQVIILDENNQQLAIGNSTALLGDPLNVILYLRDNLKAQGKFLKKGDLLSLGTITPLIPIQSNKTIRAKYIGLDENQAIEISVKFIKP